MTCVGMSRVLVVSPPQLLPATVVVQVQTASGPLAGIVEIPADGYEDPRHVLPEWGRSVAGVLRRMAQSDRPAIGFDADVTSTVPVGSGLSSSAALAVAFAVVAGEVGGFTTSPRSVALIAQAAEQAATGVPCGVMDQMASVFGRSGHALLLDCRSLEITPVTLPESMAIVVVHTGLARRLADSAYAQRRAACEAAAEQLGVDTLRDATIDQVRGDPIARHVVSENGRTLAFVGALRAGDLDRCGRLMLESHASLCDDFGVSTPELDALVDSLVAAGACGARLTGAGFGGCTVALVPADANIDAVVTDACSRYVSATGLTPMPLVVHAVDGAGPVP